MKCKMQKSDGTMCKSHPMHGSDYCYFHNPEISTSERKAAQAKGGKQRGVYVRHPLKSLRLEGARDVVHLLADTICKVRSGTLDVRTANCIGILGSQLLKAMELSDLERRVEEIEHIVK